MIKTKRGRVYVMSIQYKRIKLLDVKDIKKILPITELTIREYLKKGKIPGGQKIGKNWYVSQDNLKAFLNGDSLQDSKEKIV